MLNHPAEGDLVAERYRIVRLLGEGGMGAVYEAEHVQLKKRVALKWLHPAASMRSDATQRLVREAQAASRVRHPNVVDVYDVLQEGSTLCLVLELLEGEPLDAMLERGGDALPAIITLLLDAMRGVGEAHRKGIIHRDVHPGNIFLARRGTQVVPKVLDFGISKITDGSSVSLTQTGTAMGTPLYMSYEQICGARDIDVRTDIYAFGVILYRAATGRFPYAAETLGQLAVQLATTEPPPVRALAPAVPEALERVIMAALSRDKSARPESVDALIEALAPFASPAAYGARAPCVLAAQTGEVDALPPARSASDEPVSTPAAQTVVRVGTRASTGRRLAWAAAAALGACALGVGAYAATSPREPPAVPAPPPAGLESAPAGATEPAQTPAVREAPAESEAPTTPAVSLSPDAGAASPSRARLATPRKALGVQRARKPTPLQPASGPREPSGDDETYRAGRPPSRDDF